MTPAGGTALGCPHGATQDSEIRRGARGTQIIHRFTNLDIYQPLGPYKLDIDNLLLLIPLPASKVHG